MIRLLLPCFLILLLSNCSFLKKVPAPKGVRPDESQHHAILIKDLDPFYYPGKLPIGLSSPVFFQHKLFVGTASGEFLEINPENLKQKVILKESTAIYAPILATDDLLYVATLNGDLIAWSSLEGKEKYRVNLGSPIEAPMSVLDGRLVVPLRNHAVICLDALTGKTLWSYKRAVTSVKSLQRRSGALLLGKSAIIGFADGYLLSFRMEDGSIQWETKVTEGESRHFQDVVAEPLYFEGKILTYSYQGYLKSFKLDNGTLEKIILEKPTSNLVLKDGNVFFANTLGDIIKINTKYENTIHFSHLSDNRIYQIFSWENQLVINDHKGMIFWIDDKKTSNLNQKFELGHAYSTVFGPISGDPSYLALISSRNRLYLFH